MHLSHMLKTQCQSLINGSLIQTSTHNGPTYYGNLPGSWMHKIMQTLKLRFGWYVSNYHKEHVPKQDISPTCSLCTSQQNDTCLYLHSCNKNKHIDNFRTKHLSRAMHAFKNTLHPTTRCLMIINTEKTHNKSLQNTIPSWLLLGMCYLPGYKCPAHLRLGIPCV